jgi:membrane protein involved in colicin uptake
MPDITSTGAPEVPQNVIDKGKQSQEKRARMAAEKAAAEKAAAEKAAAEANKCTWATNLTCSSYRKLTT